MKKFLWIIVCVFCQLGMAQTTMILKGKVVVENGSLENILVANLSIEKSVYTDINGNFTIIASPDDLIVFSGNHIEYHRKLVDASDFTSEINVLLKAKMHEIDEVEIFEIKGLDAVSLGILSKPAIVFTQAERHLRTATYLDASATAGTMMGGSLSLDPLLNWISGRTKLLKNNYATETKILATKLLRNMVSDEFLVNTLNISTEKINAFLNFSVHNKEVTDAISAKNNYVLQFKLIPVAVEFNSRQKEN